MPALSKRSFPSHLTPEHLLGNLKNVSRAGACQVLRGGGAALEHPFTYGACDTAPSIQKALTAAPFHISRNWQKRKGHLLSKTLRGMGSGSEL